jgi:hypothetical protein
MATITYTSAGGVPFNSNMPKVSRGPETINRIWRFTPIQGTTSISLSTGDVVLFPNVKIPHGATILSVKLGGLHNSTAGIIGLMKFRYPDASMNAVITDISIGSATASIAGRNFVDVTNTSMTLPYVVSCSDDALNRYVIPVMVVDTATSQTLSMSLAFNVAYSMDE